MFSVSKQASFWETPSLEFLENHLASEVKSNLKLQNRLSNRANQTQIVTFCEQFVKMCPISMQFLCLVIFPSLHHFFGMDAISSKDFCKGTIFHAQILSFAKNEHKNEKLGVGDNYRAIMFGWKILGATFFYQTPKMKRVPL